MTDSAATTTYLLLDRQSSLSGWGERVRKKRVTRIENRPKAQPCKTQGKTISAFFGGGGEHLAQFICYSWVPAAWARSQGAEVVRGGAWQ